MRTFAALLLVTALGTASAAVVDIILHRSFHILVRIGEKERGRVIDQTMRVQDGTGRAFRQLIDRDEGHFESLLNSLDRSFF